MSSTEPNQNMLEVARRVVGEVAPAEAPLFEPLSQAYLEHPSDLVGDKSSSDDLLGFGGLEAVPMLTPIIVAQVSQLFSFAQATIAQLPPNAVAQLGALGAEHAQEAAAQIPGVLELLGEKSLERSGEMIGSSVILWFLNHLVNTASKGVQRAGLPTAQVAQVEQFLTERLRKEATEAQAHAIAMAMLNAVGIHAEDPRRE